MIDKHTSVSEAEVDFLRGLGWESTGWKDGADWYLKPSFGPVIWITDDPKYMTQWLSDREAFAHKRLRENAEKHALKLLDALKAVREQCLFADDEVPGGIGFTNEPYISDELFAQICAAIAAAEPTTDEAEADE